MLAADLTEPAAVDRIIEATAGLTVGLLIYNAGGNTCSEKFLDGELADFATDIELNINAPMLVRHYGGGMRDRRRGGILLVGSMAGYLGSRQHTGHGGVKAYSRVFAEGLWLELRGHNVDVLEFVLGVTRTPAMERVGLNFDVPGIRVAEPAEVARQGLEKLAGGPVFIAGGNGPAGERCNSLDPAKVVLDTHRFMPQLIGQD